MEAEKWMGSLDDGRPLIAFGREVCGDLTAGLRREWLVTNGLGGYASGTLASINSRRYHGLLVAALTPCVGRTVLAGGLVEAAAYDGRAYDLSTNEYADGTIDPRGYRYLQSFALDGALPVWTFAFGDALLERRVWMAYGANTTYVRYRLVRGTLPVELRLTPLVTYRDFHALSSGRGWQPAVEPRENGATVQAWDGATPFVLLCRDAAFAPGGGWYWNFLHREEAARGLDDRSDLYAAGSFTATLSPGEAITLVFSTDADADLDGEGALTAARERQRDLLRAADAEDAGPVVQQLVLAADQFLVERRGADGTGRSVIAGYHWFNDWGRDTMIALPGLALATGRAVEAAAILRSFARYLRDGLLPNNFPDSADADPGYNTADATLWFVLAVRACYRVTADEAMIDELLPALRKVVEHHLRGTRYGIGVDAGDGLLHAGEAGVQLTWMDAKVGDWVVTPRTGKPVEINALWYNALRTLAELLASRDAAEAARYATLAEQARESFRKRFLRPDRLLLADVVDGPDGDDWSLRPNQIFAVSLPFPLLEGEEARAVVDAVGRELLTSTGLRSLSAADPRYQGDYGGDQRRRDGAYHQGPAWCWLLGPYAEAHFRVHSDARAALALLQPIAQHLADAGLGSISEIAEGDPPHLPRGCVAQAWSVAEVLRVWRLLDPAAP
jgi:predicted glycogen debranching enzyme